VASNVERLRALLERFNEAGEVDFTHVHPDAELHDRPDVPDGRVWRGIDGGMNSTDIRHSAADWATAPADTRPHAPVEMAEIEQGGGA
jgi:hypothetical protein